MTLLTTLQKREEVVGRNAASFLPGGGNRIIIFRGIIIVSPCMVVLFNLWEIVDILPSLKTRRGACPIEISNGLRTDCEFLWNVREGSNFTYWKYYVVESTIVYYTIIVFYRIFYTTIV